MNGDASQLDLSEHTQVQLNNDLFLEGTKPLYSEFIHKSLLLRIYTQPATVMLNKNQDILMNSRHKSMWSNS